MFDLLSLAMGILNLAAPRHVQQSIPVFILEIFSVILIVNARNLQPVDVHGRCDSLSFEEGYSTIWGRPNILEDGCTVQLTLDEHSGSGFMSLDDYHYGFFSASIKLPADYTAGVVLAFYASNGDTFKKNHDELDFEFLGNLPGKKWRMQTNVYGNGSVARGREERFDFWFDPTADFHDYSILWNAQHIVFMVDNIPIRENLKTKALGGDFPSKPMAVYATIWDGSGWATDGGRYPVDYKYAPFIATFANMKLEGCATDPTGEGADECEILESSNPDNSSTLLSLGGNQEVPLEWVRRNYMYYSYCDDKARYPVSLPECNSQVTSSLSRRTSPATSMPSRKRKSRSRRSHSRGARSRIAGRRGRTPH